MKEKIKVTAAFQVAPEVLYNSWLSSSEHTKFTGSKAVIKPVVGSKFSAWDGYISGKLQILEPFKKIVQSWRTTDFPADCPDSILEIRFEKKDKGSKIILMQSEIPDGQGQSYKQGWKDFYFLPMKKYFSK